MFLKLKLMPNTNTGEQEVIYLNPKFIKTMKGNYNSSGTLIDIEGARIETSYPVETIIEYIENNQILENQKKG